MIRPKNHPGTLFLLLASFLRVGAQSTAPTALTTYDSTMQAQIRQLTEQYQPWVIAIRRHLHTHPELSGEERATQAFIATTLDSLGISYRLGVGGGYSVVAEIHGRTPGRGRIVLRADTDALPIFEVNEVPYKSQNPGVSHKCGHDVHTANLLGVARVLHELRDRFEGVAVCAWQPHEEKLPGGALPLIQAGLLDGASLCLGLHVDPNLPVGSIGLRPGEYMASIDELHVRIIGQGTHGGSGLHLGIDPIMASAHLLVALDQLKTRNCDARIPMVLSFGKIAGGEAPNVIPDTVQLLGTFRTLNDAWREKAHQRMLEIAGGVALSTGTRIEFDIVKGHPVLVNDPSLTALVKSSAVEFIGAGAVRDLDVWLASEDFAHYGKVVPACFFRLGVRNEARGITAGLHTNTFDADEAAFRTGVGVLAWAAIRALADFGKQ